MIVTNNEPVNTCTCDLCAHTWKSLTVPATCPNCKSRTWNGGKQRGRPKNPNTVAKPAPAKRKRKAKEHPGFPEYEAKW